MKKIMIWLFCLLFVACEEPALVEPNPPIVPPAPKKFTVDISSINATTTPSGKFDVNEGTNLDLVATASSGWVLDSLYVNNEKTLLTGKSYSMTFPNIATKYTIKVIAKKEIIIPTRTDTLCGLGWGLKEIKYLLDGNWVIANLVESQTSRRIYFKVDNNYTVLDKYGVPTGGGGRWEWIGSDSLRIDGMRVKYTLSMNILTWSQRGGTIIDRYER